ncbi:hypothetical protein EJB05_42149 [Eragrostis curvula]|uniref:DDE Tnp4 domain-containing protein n=1 Tax=Eragrostis curvula TaxID=38414 RepID=A0A5J9TC14_9POAL|nr:hypothetical protein EJB05_42149 [Eragrostis curvula]
MPALRICNMNSSSGKTIHRHVKPVFDIIPALTYRFVKHTLPTETHRKINTDACFFPYFKNFICAIDGTHIHITISQAKQAP